MAPFITGQSESQPVLYLKCSLTDILREKLKIPQINEAREKALAIAAQLQMSALEHERRKVTGTLESSSVRAATAVLGLTTVEVKTILAADSTRYLFCFIAFKADNQAKLLLHSLKS